MSDRIYWMGAPESPAPPSREAEIAARLAGLSTYALYVHGHDVREDVRYLLAQLQQAEQARDAALAALKGVQSTVRVWCWCDPSYGGSSHQPKCDAAQSVLKAQEHG